MTIDLRDAALDYLAAGLHILALDGKKPNFRVHGENWSYEDSFHGPPLTDADCEAIELSFNGRGTTGIAILIPPDFVVADVDTERAAALLVELGGEPNVDTVGSKTKNGLHIWFWYPGADRNRWLGDGKQPDPGRTLLFKGLGGYVVAPPSLHFAADGTQDGTYSWGANPLVVGGKIFMPDPLPTQIAEQFRREDLWTADRQEHRDTVSSFTMTPVEGVPWYQWPKVHTYNTEGLERAIEKAADGNQNNVIHWAALTCHEEGVPYEVAMERLLAAAVRGNHPRSRARDTIRGAYKRRVRG
jgi:hypothetical protein